MGGLQAGLSKRYFISEDESTAAERGIQELATVLVQESKPYCSEPKNILYTHQVMATLGDIWFRDKVNPGFIGQIVREVNWARGPHWLGVALIQRPNKAYSLTGATSGNLSIMREVLTNVTAEGYHRIRQDGLVAA